MSCSYKLVFFGDGEEQAGIAASSGADHDFLDSDLIEQGYLEPKTAEYGCRYCLCYHICLILEDVELLNDVYFVYGTGSSIVAGDEEEDAVKVYKEVVAAQDSSSRHKVHASANLNEESLGTCRWVLIY